MVAASYAGLPPVIPILRIAIGHVVMVAHKSPFMVFRVPVMNTIHGVMAAIMLRYAPGFADSARRRGYCNVFWALLICVGFKSLLEASDFAATAFPRAFGWSETWLVPCTLATVILGVGVAAWQSTNVRLPWPELRMKRRDIVLLVGLFGIYLAIVAGSVVGSHRIPS